MTTQTDTPPAPTSTPAPRTVRLVPLAAIIQDNRTWPRRELDNERVKLFAELYAGDADTLPPIEIFPYKPQGQTKPVYMLVAGWHRMAARKKMRASNIPAIIRDDLRTLDDAFIAACEDDATAAKPLSSREKHDAVRRILNTRSDLSDRAIARTVGCSHTFVSQQRNRLLRLLSQAGDALTSGSQPIRSGPRPIEQRVVELLIKPSADEPDVSALTTWARYTPGARDAMARWANAFAAAYRASAPTVPPPGASSS